uniref:Transcription factor E2F4 n=1 Tax=Haemonchus contortus TaxID=6289 RepID=A0A7I4Z3G3_HAECO
MYVHMYVSCVCYVCNVCYVCYVMYACDVCIYMYICIYVPTLYIYIILYLYPTSLYPTIYNSPSGSVVTFAACRKGECRDRGEVPLPIEELGKLLGEDSVAGRMRAIAELRELKIRPNQEVADFCVALKKLGRKANPQGQLQRRRKKRLNIWLHLSSYLKECTEGHTRRKIDIATGS